MTTISALYGHNPPLNAVHHDRIMHPSRGVGIEIEAEAYKPSFFKPDPKRTHRYWSVDGDGSLRNGGVEFRSCILYGAHIVNALEQVQPALSECDLSWRAGIHVHVDVRDMTANQLINACSVYSLLERLIFEWEGHGRQESNFCVPWYLDNTYLKSLSKWLRLDAKADRQRDRKMMEIEQMWNKYSALNLLPLVNQGSIEFRLMQTTDNIDRIIDYVNICTSIVQTATEVEDNPLVMVSTMGPMRFILEYVRLPMLAEIPNADELLWKGVDYTNMVPVLSKDVPLENKVGNLRDFPVIDI